mmetsp:Transcript_4638/g.5737  ORF Transcript_4638/g.5737 Transcript_4638/m.5737 type:complete len:694 (-) Transcript_4638:136-2217(-)|eukprot:CAMPEP_0184056924 /NCGR_PEP_ID=MMETSP0956-20121227/8112_1 /TAXON_ID=627963 /ORGANISM="Aplanochytrium sp, Strain PBS07" /LENGTH=693 /DNA_ID=CAMNT_0026351133 /DNA_START=247 /DNA_END=2331 /DNA_ORIENTATION=+
MSYSNKTGTSASSFGDVRPSLYNGSLRSVRSKESVATEYAFDDTEIDFLEGRAEDKKVVIGLDFGSTHSGFAYALTAKRVVRCSPMKENGQFKEPSCALFEKDGTLIAYGLDARNTYLKRLAEERTIGAVGGNKANVSSDYLYFDYDKLKMRLYARGRSKSVSSAQGTREIKTRTHKSRKGKSKKKKKDDDTIDAPILTAKSVTGDEVPLQPLVAAILDRLRAIAMKYIRTNEDGCADLVESDVLWVLTVPAIWLESDKQFMREAARQARIIDDVNSNDLILALEPECAAVRIAALKNINLQTGDKLLVLDCGGGTVDVCAIEVSSDRKSDGRYRFRQLLEPSGGNWGATYIDDRFYRFLKKLCGSEVMEHVEHNPAILQEIRHGWERLKCSLKRKDFVEGQEGRTLQLDRLVEILPESMSELVKRYNQIHKHHVGIKRTGVIKKDLLLTPSILRTFFDPVIVKIVKHAVNLVKKPELENLKHVVLVGGLGQCDYLRASLMKVLNRDVIVPSETSSVVMKGAVEFGMQPGVIEARRAALTIGVKTILPYELTKHNVPPHKEHKYYDRNQKAHYIRDVFLKLVERGEVVRVNQEVTQRFRAANGMPSIKFDIYGSMRNDIEYVTNPMCKRLGKLVIPVEPGTEATFTCSIQVGFTELMAKVKNEDTGVEEKMQIQLNRVGENAIVLDYATPTED